MKAYKIDVVKQEIYPVEIKKHDLNDIYKQLECSVFDVGHTFENNDSIYVDDEGLLVPEEERKGLFGVQTKSYSYKMLFGHGLIIGTNKNGESIDVKSDLEEIKKIIHFPGKT